MSRAIKFRVWFESHGIMGNVVTLKGSNRTNYDADMWDEVTAECCIDGKQQFFTSYNFKLLQFTGLLDKNGKEIYESDIVKLDNGDDETMTEVRFVDGAFIVEWDNGFLGGDADLQAVGWAMHECSVEVLGNIYQNPELCLSR